MTSAINDTFLTSINEAYPVAGVNNSSEGFRSNFARIKEGLGTAGKELTYLQDKRIEVIGDATGISGALGNSLNQPTPITLTLAATGAVAGTYTSEHKHLTLTVDAKGRITSVATVDEPTRPGVIGEFKPIATNVSTASGNVRELTVPSFTFDEYGTLVAANAAADVLSFGPEGHVMPKGTILVGHETDGSKYFPLPQISYNPLEQVVLTWKPVSGNAWSVSWEKIPPLPPVNPAQVISVVGGEGITVSTDPANPTVEFDLTKFPEFPTGQAIAAGSKVVLWDSGTNAEYKVDVSRLTTTPVMTFKVKDDTAPELGGDLRVGARKIVGNRINGIVMDTRDAGPFIIRNTQTIDPNFYNPNDPNSSVTLPEDQWVIKDQKFPLKPPAFTPAEVTAGTTNAFMKIDANGQMYWDKTAMSPGGVQRLTAGAGIEFDPIGDITTTGTIALDFSSEPVEIPDIYSDVLVAIDANRLLYRNTVSEFTFTMRKVAAVDPVYGSDVAHPSRGQLNRPFRTIGAAIQAIPVGSPDLNQIMLLPGRYEEPLFNINRPNVQLISLLGPETTVVRAGFKLYEGMGTTIIKGIQFDISNITVNAPTAIMLAEDGIHGLQVEDCWFYQDPTEYGRPQEIIRLTGTQTGNVHFERCKFNGYFFNNLEFDDATGFLDGRVQINNTISDGNHMLAIVTAANTNTTVNNVDLLWQAQHKGGIIELKNIAGIVGDFSDDLWASIDPDTQDLETMGYVKEGVQSTAGYLSSGANFLTMTNICLRNFVENRYYVTSSITKTGTCEYTMSNISRKSDVDTLVGNRYDNHGMPKTDISDQIVKANVNGNYTCDARKAATWDLTLTGNSQVTVTGPITMDNPYADVAQSLSVRILIHQDATGSRTLSWAVTDGSIVWDGGVAPIMPSTANSMMLVELIQVGAFWLGRKLVSN